jgi:hypothetical protein
MHVPKGASPSYWESMPEPVKQEVIASNGLKIAYWGVSKDGKPQARVTTSLNLGWFAKALQHAAQNDLYIR